MQRVLSLAAVVCAICPPTNGNLPSTSCARGAPILPSLPDRASFTTFPWTSPPTHFTPPGQLFLSFNGPDQRLSWDPHGDRAYYLGSALTHYRCHRVYVVSTRTERITLTLAHFLLPFFHFAESDLPPPLPTSPTSARPSLTLDGTDLIGQFFNGPDLVLCRLVPGEDKLDPTGPQLQAGWVTTLRYTALGGATHTCQQDVVAVLL